MSKPDSEKFAELPRREDEIRKLVDILMGSKAIKTVPDPLVPVLYADNAPYHIFPTNFKVVVNYNKLAAAVYDAGYRTIEEKGE